MNNPPVNLPVSVFFFIFQFVFFISAYFGKGANLFCISPFVGLSEVLSVKPDPNYNSKQKDYTASNIDFIANIGNLQLFPAGNTKHWLVRMDKPGIGVVTKAQMVDYYTQILTKVLGK